MGQVAFGFYLAAAMMAIGGVAELAFGVRAEQRSLEQIATPLTAQEADASEGENAPEEEKAPTAASPPPRPSRRDRYRLGPGTVRSSPGMWASVPVAPVPFDDEVEAIVDALRENGPTDRATRAKLVGARWWGPGRFRGALVDALVKQRVRQVKHGRFDAAHGS